VSAVGERTRDALFGGRVTLHQPVRGYRANVDALLLASFAAGPAGAPRPAKLAVDLGAGAGAVALALLHLGAASRALLVEIDRATAALAETNLEANGWADRGEVLCADVEALPSKLEADLVVCNPPYVPEGHGRPARDASRARARSGDLAVFVRAARRAAGRRARACFVYPAHGLAQLLALFRVSGLEPKRARCVHASGEAAARIVLVEARPAKPGGLVFEPPLFERDGRGYGAELRALLDSPGHAGGARDGPSRRI
jgi:tRNA1Val (adenine37-N6)-methyltransferase